MNAHITAQKYEHKYNRNRTVTTSKPPKDKDYHLFNVSKPSSQIVAGSGHWYYTWHLFQAKGKKYPKVADTVFWSCYQAA